jgi:hypothetical protein
MFLEMIQAIEAHETSTHITMQYSRHEVEQEAPRDFDESEFTLKPAVLLKIDGCYIDGTPNSQSREMTIIRCDPPDIAGNNPALADAVSAAPWFASGSEVDWRGPTRAPAQHSGGLFGRMIRACFVVIALSSLGLSYRTLRPSER